MNWKKISILAVVLAFLAAAIVYVNRRGKGRPEAEGILYDIAPDAVEKIELLNRSGRFVFARQETLWRLEAPLAAKADKVALEGILDNFCRLTYDRLVEENAAELKDFGLNRPEIELRLFAKGKPPRTLLLGMKNVIDDSSYAKLADGGRVVTVAAYKRGALDKDLFAFRDKKFLAIDALAVHALHYRREASDVSLARKETGWFLEKPVYSLAQESKVSDILSAAAGLEAQSFAPAPAGGAVGEFGLDKPVLVAEFRSPAGTRQVTVGRKGDAYYALADGSSEICGIAKDFLDKFAANAADLRETKVAPFYAFDVRELALRQGAFGFTARKDAAGAWKLDGPAQGKKPSAEKIESLLTSLAGLEASEFIEGAKELPPFPTRIILKTEDPADPKKTSSIVMEFSAAEGDAVVVRNPALPYLFKTGKEILEKMPAKLEDICEEEAKAAVPET